MEEFIGAVKPHKSGVMLSLVVTPNSSKPVFPAGYDKWRQRLEVKVQSPPSKNKANIEVIDVLSKFFNIRRGDIDIVAGEHSRMKQVLIKSVNYETVLNKLKGEL